jgi:zinc protease
MIVTGLCLMGSATSTHAASALDISSFTLENGLTVVVAPVHRVPVISHHLMIYAGAADDPLGHSGVAHFLEHMLFKGTPDVPEGEYSRQVEGMGGQYNAFTSADMTGYYVTVAKAHLETVMKLEADRMMHLAPKPDMYITEKAVVIEERKLRVDTNPAALLNEAMNAALFRHHPYGTPIIGWAHEMALLDEPTAKAFLHRFYTPSNAALILVGDITVEEAKTLTKRYYGGWIGAPKQHRNWVDEPPRNASDSLVMHHENVTLPRMGRSYLAPGISNSKDIAGSVMPLIIAEELLGHPRTGLLYRELVEKQKLATDVSVDYNPFVIGPGTLDVSMTPANGVSTDKLASAYEATMQHFMQGTIDPQAMLRARNQLKASTIFARDSVQGMAFILSQLVMIGMEPEWLNQWGTLVDAVTPEQIIKAVASTFRDDTAVTGILLPPASKEVAP